MGTGLTNTLHCSCLFLHGKTLFDVYPVSGISTYICMHIRIYIYITTYTYTYTLHTRVLIDIPANMIYLMYIYI